MWNHTNLQLHENFIASGVQVCNWFCEMVHSGEVDSLLNYFTSEIT